MRFSSEQAQGKGKPKYPRSHCRRHLLCSPLTVPRGTGQKAWSHTPASPRRPSGTGTQRAGHPNGRSTQDKSRKHRRETKGFCLPDPGLPSSGQKLRQERPGNPPGSVQPGAVGSRQAVPRPPVTGRIPQQTEEAERHMCGADAGNIFQKLRRAGTMQKGHFRV